MKDADEKLYQFVVEKNGRTYLEVVRYIEIICKSVLWEHFKKRDTYLIDDAKSYATLRLLVSRPLAKGNLSGYVYSLVKKYYLDVDRKIIYTDDINQFDYTYSFTPNTKDDDKNCRYNQTG